MVDHCKRLAPTYYIKGKKGEVDVALVLNEKMFPVEVKWTGQIRPETMKQILIYSNGIVLTKKNYGHEIRPGESRFVPLIRFLLHTENRQLILE